MTNTAIYTRISMDRTGEQLGSQRQYDACLELANRLGWNIIKHFDDDDISAYSGKRRPGFEALLDAMADGAVDAFIVWHTDRLYRSMKDLERLIEIAEANRVQIRTVQSGELDLSTSAGRMIARILGSVARQESEHKGERHKAANAQARESGKWRNGGAAVFGYDSKGQVVEHEGVLIRAAAKDLLAGRSLRSLAKEWTRNGILTRRGGPWSVPGFRHMIGNPRYAALMTHQPKGQERKVIGKGLWPAIIDEDTHLAIRALLDDPTRLNHHSFERVYMGSGVYVCGECGGKLRPVSSKPSSPGSEKRQVSYGCPACFHVSVKVETLDGYIETVILKRLADSDTGRYIDDTKDDVAELARRRDGLQERLNEMGRMFAAGEIDGLQLKSGSAELHCNERHQQPTGLAAADLARGEPAQR